MRQGHGDDNGHPVFLIGYMCSGKTTLGRALASRLGVDFVDLDEEVESRAGRSITRIFTEDGEVAFRRLEAETLDDIIARYGATSAVVAVGGGTPCHGTNIERMNAAGLTVHLVTTVDRLIKRLEEGRASRPLVADKTADELRRFVVDALIDRVPYYDRAEAVFDSTFLEDNEQIAASVTRFINMLDLRGQALGTQRNPSTLNTQL